MQMIQHTSIKTNLLVHSDFSKKDKERQKSKTPTNFTKSKQHQLLILKIDM